MTVDTQRLISSDLLRFRDDLSRAAAASSTEHFPAFVGKVVGSPASGTGVGRYVTVHPVSVLGAEVEGGTATLIEDSATSIVVYVLGTRAPASGDRLVCRFIENRWVAQVGGKTGKVPRGQLLSCLCATPPLTLRMNVSREGCGDGLMHSCTIAYGPTPAALAALRLGSSCYLSTQTFADSQTGDQFYYYLGCYSSILRISRAFPTSIFGSPFLDSVVYYWSIGLPGNTCSPFLLSNGQIFPGGDPTCLVTITE